jgi:hypothetical protein
VSVTPLDSVEICNGSSALLQASANMSVSYLWQVNANNLVSATNSTYYASLASTYRVVVRTSAGCADTSNSVVVTVRLCNAISGLEYENSVLVYPNPANDELLIQSDLFTADNISLSVFDVTGKKQTVNYKSHNNVIKLNTSLLASGSYSIKLNVSGKEVSRKFIKID